MKEYKIFKHVDGTFEAVKQGWSWPAFFFGAIWALVKKIWWLGFGIIGFAAISALVVVNVVTTESGLIAASMVQNLVALGIFVVLGAKGNGLREDNLLSRGYECVSKVNAESPDAAIVLCRDGSTVRAA